MNISNISSSEAASTALKVPNISKAIAPYEPFYERILPTGSRVMVDPPPTDTDWDFLVLCTPEMRPSFETRLQLEGWELGGSLPNTGLNIDPSDVSWTLNTEHEYKELFDGSHAIDHSRVFHSWKRQETPAVYDHQHGESTDPFSILSTVVTPSEGPEINLLVTCNEQYFQDFTRATFLCQALNLKDKADRVTVFEALTRDVWPTGPKKKKSWNIYKDLTWKYLTETPPMTAMGVVQLQQAQALLNPPSVVEANPDGVDLGPGMSIPPTGWWTSPTPVAMH